MGRFEVEEAQAVSVLEAAHAGHDQLQPWLDELVAALERLVPAAELAAGVVVQRHATHWDLVAGDTRAHANGPISSFGKMLPQIDPAALDPYYRTPRHVVTHSLVRRADPAAGTVGDGFLAALGMRDSVSLTSQCTDGVSMTVFAMSPRTIEIAPRHRLVLARAAAHMEAALRLRVDDAELVAVIDVDGRLRYADGESRHPVHRAALASQVRTIERQRLRRERRRPGAIDAWNALVRGRFGIVENADGPRREYHVYAHPPHVWSARALTRREASVLELSARGLSGKLVAYSLGISFASVSEALASAAVKSGFGSRAELVRMAATVLRPDAPPIDVARLTPAEREVLQMLRDGRSNSAIAAARGTSAQTVANQVGSLLRKSGRGSRRALAASTFKSS